MASRFPLNIEANWRAYDEVKSSGELSENLSSWLGESGSLTTRLKAQCNEFKVQVLSQSELSINEQLAKEMNIEVQVAIVREVLLHCDGQAKVYAQTIMPYDSLTGTEAELSNLGDKPLGHVIFQHPALARQSLSVAKYTEHSPVIDIAGEIGLPSQAIWGRRSIYTLHDKPIQVCELFLPGSYPYSQEAIHVAS